MPGGELLGVIGVREPRHEIGYWMGAAHRGAGLMSEAAVAVADWALAGGIRGATTLFWRRRGYRRPPAWRAAAGFRRIEPADPTVPARDGDALPAWHAVRTVPADPRASRAGPTSWAGVTGDAASPVVLFDLDDTLMAHREAVVAGILLTCANAHTTATSTRRPAAGTSSRRSTTPRTSTAP